MSMSTLGAQLAAISAPGRNAGSALATSKRHEDAVGRGLAHSVQVGHTMNNKSHLYKASILHQDARTASDVPLATIRENCVTSLQHLESIDADFGSFVDLLCKSSIQERGLMMAAENDKVDKHIEDLLYRLSLVMGGSSGKKTNDNLLSCLNVIEFLLRKYEIHIRPKSACTVLLTMLPHHEEPYFLRILQLVDLASLPEWAFLRPYAIPGAKLGRSILAQNASKDIAMIRNLGRLSQRNSKLPGASKSLSFTAAVLVEALTLQTQRKGCMEERTCQVLLPFVVNACKNEQYYKKAKSGKQTFDGSLWQNWGYILASTLVENAVLAPEPRSLLVTSILQGLALQQETATKSNNNRKTDSHLSSGLMVSLTILAQNPAESSFTTEDNEKDSSSYLPLLSSSSTVAAKQCGFPTIDKDIFSALLKLEDYDNESSKDTKNIKNTKSKVAACVANLYHQDGMVDFQQWVASILVFGWKRFIKYRKQNHDQTDKRSRKAKINSTKILNLILNLAKHSHLDQLWKQNDAQWVESFVSFVLQNTPLSVLNALKEEATVDKESRFSEEEYVRAILQTLRSIDGVAYDRGITHALIRTKDSDDRMGLAKYLGLAKTKSMSIDSSGEPSEEGEPDEPTIKLPPRVGLEHADSRIRLEAISSLLEEAKDEQDKMEIDDDGESTSRALFRRFLMDDNRQVALAASKALEEILGLNNKQIETAVGIVELSEGALEALYRWARSSADKEKLKEELLARSCRIASSAIKALRASNQTDLSFLQLVEGLGAFLLHSNDSVSRAAAEGILSAFDKAKKSKNAGEIKKQAMALLISEDTILQGFQRGFRERNSSELHIRRQLSRVVLNAISTASSKTNVSTKTLEYSIWLIETFGSSLSQDETKALADSLLALSSCLPTELESIHSTFCRLASNEDSLFDGVAVPYIHATCENVKDKQGGDVSPVAVVMEVALSSDSFDQIKNLLSVANEMVSKDSLGNFYSIAPTLALCCHQDEKIRRLAVAFLSQLSKRLSKASNNDDWMVLNILCQYLSEKKSSVVLKGASFISESLATLLSSSDEASSIRKYLLQAILCSATAYAGKDSISSSDFFANSWLDGGNITGGYKTASTLLDVTESAGEAAFPVLTRWESVGQPLLSQFLSKLSPTDDNAPYQQSQFIHAVVKILRGTTVSIPSSLGVSSTSTIISTGPSSHGRRARSYSFGKSDGVGALNPYPASMQESIVSILTTKTESSVNNEIRICLFELVLNSSSWRTKVFSQLNGKIRQKIASAMLVAATESLYQGVDSVLLSLPLDANDISKLMRDQGSDEVGLSKLTFISDFISMNHSKLSTSSGVNDLFATVFKTLAKFTETKEDNESIEFARHALLSALLELIHSSLDLDSMSSDLSAKKKTFDSWLNTLLLTVSNSAELSVPLRSKRVIFFIFASLCNKYPKTVTPKLIPLMNGLVSHSLSPGEENTLVNCFDLIIPVFFKQAAASNLSPVDLFESFINCVCKYDEQVRPKFYMAFVHALSMIPKKGDFEASAVGSFVAAVLARERYCPSDKVPAKNLFSKLPELATQILSSTSRETRIKAVWTMQNYAKEILFNILEGESTSTPDAFFPAQNLVEIATKGPNSIGNKASKQSLSDVSSSVVVESLCSLLISVTCEVVTSYDLRNIIKCTDGSGSAIVLRLWQDLLLIQSACHNRLGGSGNHEKSELLERIVEITAQALECIQSSLPSHIFLAFVTSLVTEGETQELRARAVQLIAERSASSYMGKSEAALFVEMIPALLKLLDDGTGDFLHQSVFAAVDSIGRNACISGESPVNDRHVGIFSNATFKAAGILEREMLPSSKTFLDIPAESRQLVSSAALCSSTAIKICGPRALPVLPKLMKPLLSFLVAATSFIESSTNEEDGIDKKELSQAKLMQLAIMRTFRSIVERMPMLLQPYLVGILTTFGKVSGSFLSDSLNQTHSIQTEMVSLQKIMTSNIPTRQLIPAASKSIFSTPNVELNLSNLSIMIESITNSKSSEVSGMIGLVIKTATHVFDQDSMQGGSSAVMQAADELLLCLVMKLSEVQLRSLYRKLREWRGDLDRSDPEQSAARRSAFWRFSSTLSKNLKSIYLSCLTTVFSDAVDELEMAVSCLPEKDGVKKANGKKRQRVTNSEESSKFQSSSFLALKNLLLCLELSLRSDAHEGGDWIREMESQRYDKLMEPLGKLMHCRLPNNDSNMTFESLVQGEESQSGSIVECLVALASAAGDEQLWKPLNHAILQACSDEDRLEVRKAGVTCLLSLINSIGEEYMVLIPECLPVLSELLEDPDEDVSGTAQECISQSEELLGESLQDSLR